MATDTQSNGRSRHRQIEPGEARATAENEPFGVLVQNDAIDDRSPQATRQSVPVRVKRTTASKRIRAAAAISGSWSIRESLRRLADLIRRGAGNPQRAQFIEDAIVACLDEARDAEPADRWLACESATWALGWMARSRRAGGSAGSLLERLVQDASLAIGLVTNGDTLPARFIFVLARLFADIEACRRFESVAANAVAAEIDRLVSPRGTVHGAGSAAIVDRVVRWCRFREVASWTGCPAWGAATERRWREAATAAVRLLGRHGRVITTGGLLPLPFTHPLLDAVNGLGRRRTKTIRAVRCPPSSTGKPRQFIRRDLHDASAAVAVIRSGWDAASVRLLIDYSRPVPWIEIAVADRLLASGPWTWSLSLDGRPLEVEGAWTMSCWESDRKATFLEITAPLPGGRQFERQVVLLPRDRIFLMADAVTTAGASPVANGVVAANAAASPTGLRLRTCLPLASGLDADPAVDTREVLAFDTGMRLTALPLALPEWRASGRGSFAAGPDGLTLTQETAGPRCYAAMWLDLDPRRAGRQVTWRQLTVADTRIILPPHQAVGFRVQVGQDQWLVYRALDAPRNRTLLGCNVSCEFLLGRIKRDGTVQRLIEIE
jgi:hypothetical protein